MLNTSSFSINPFDSILQKQIPQKKINAGFILRMPGNYQPMYDVFEEKLQNKLFRQEKAKIDFMAKIIKGNQDHSLESNLGFFGSLLSFQFWQKTNDNLHVLDKNFRVDENCTHCGMCEKVCPTQNIQLQQGKPIWSGKCENCFACFHCCPARSIQYGKKSHLHKRYHHPDAKVNDFIGIK